VYPAAKGVAAYESYDPEDEKNNGDCPKHFVLLDDFRFYFSGFASNGVQNMSPSCGKLPGTSRGLPVRIKYESDVTHTRGT
jgi:hypothetical protein